MAEENKLNKMASEKARLNSRITKKREQKEKMESIADALEEENGKVQFNACDEEYQEHKELTERVKRKSEELIGQLNKLHSKRAMLSVRKLWQEAEDHLEECSAEEEEDEDEEDEDQDDE